jgi:hypothetical protein
MPVPAAVALGLKYGIPAAGSFLSGLFGGRREDKRREEDRQHDRDMQQQDVASRESALDPVRQQLQQASALTRLDRVANGSYTPVRFNLGGPYASYVPQTSGGYSYEATPDVRAGIGLLRDDVLQGRSAPSMTNPANYGRNAVLDLRAMLDGEEPDFGTPPPSRGPNQPTNGRRPRSVPRLPPADTEYRPSYYG